MWYDFQKAFKYNFSEIFVKLLIAYFQDVAFFRV